MPRKPSEKLSDNETVLLVHGDAWFYEAKRVSFGRISRDRRSRIYGQIAEAIVKEHEGTLTSAKDVLISGAPARELVLTGMATADVIEERRDDRRLTVKVRFAVVGTSLYMFTSNYSPKITGAARAADTFLDSCKISN